jgi:hypothetical protein
VRRPLPLAGACRLPMTTQGVQTRFADILAALHE